MEKQDMFLLIVGVSISACATAIFKRQILSLVEAFFRMLLSPIAVAVTSLQHLWHCIGDAYRKQLASENGSLDMQRIFFEIVGSVLYSISFGFFVFADFHLFLLTLAAMGIEGNVEIFPGGTATATALAMISSFLFFGLVLWDLAKMSQLAPWHQRLSSSWRKAVVIICITSLLLSLITTGLCGYWRGKANQEDNLYPATSGISALNTGGLDGFYNIPIPSPNNPGEAMIQPDAWIPLVVNINIPLLLIMGSCLAGYGVVQLIKFIVLGVVFIIFLPTFLVLVVFGYLSRVINDIYLLSVSLIELPVAVGLWILGLFKYHPKDISSSDPGNDDTIPADDESISSNDNDSFINPYENRKESSDE